MRTLSIQRLFALPLFLTVCLMAFSVPALAKDENFGLHKYAEELVPSDYSVRFKAQETQMDYKLLRDYLDEKKTLIFELVDLLETDFSDAQKNFESIEYDMEVLESKINEAVEKSSGDGSFEIDLDDLGENFQNTDVLDYLDVRWNYYDTWGEILDRSDIDLLKEEMQKVKRDAKEDKDAMTMIRSNLETIEMDVKSCERQIDKVLQPEQRQQAFKFQSTIVFAALVGTVFLLFFVALITTKREFLVKALLSPIGLQFITIFILIIAIILFGVLDILEGRELAAILAGISGYILGRGTKGEEKYLESLSKSVEKDFAQAPKPAEKPKEEKADDKKKDDEELPKPPVGS